MSNTKYYTKINDIILNKVRSLTVEKNLSQYSGKFALSVSDPDNLYYNEFTSGDEIEVVENYIESPVEREQSYATAHAINWYKFNDNLTDSSGITTPSIQVRATAYYPFNGNANDESTSGNNGTVSGATLTTDRFGVANKAYLFDGVDNKITLSNLGFTTTSPISISGWFKLNADGINNFESQPLVTTNYVYVYVRGAENQIQVRYDNPTSSRISVYNIGNGDRDWHHFVATFNGDKTTAIYLDGVLRDSDTHIDAPSIEYEFGISKIGVRSGGYFNGKIDEVIILPVALTSTEVAALYELQSRHDWNDVFVDGKFGKAAEMLMVGIENNAPCYGPSIDFGSTIYLPYNGCSISWWFKGRSDMFDEWSLSRLFTGGQNATSGKVDLDSNGLIKWESLTNNKWEVNFSSGIDFTDETWHHYVLTSGVNDTKLYVDGLLVDIKTAITDAIDQKFRYIGSYCNSIYSYGSGLQGAIDDVRFFDKELTAQEVQEIYWNLAETKVFGGFLENVKRDKDNKYILDIDGGDYTTKFNNIIVLAEVYNGREYSVIIRDLVHKYAMFTNIIDNCDSVTGWSATNGTLTLETGTDTNGYLISRLGEACLKVIPTDTTIDISKTMDFGYDYLNTDYIGIYLFIEDVSKFNSINLKIGQDNSNYYLISNTINELENGWNYVEFDLSTATSVGTPSLNNIIYFEINIDLDDTSNIIYIDDLMKIPHGSDDYTVSNVEVTPYYTDIKFKNVSLYDAIRKVKEIRPNTYDFYVDINKVLNFGYFGEISSGQLLERGKNVLKSEFWDDDTKLCNKVTVYAAKQEFGYSETFSGDNTTKEFGLEYQPISQEVYISGVLKKGYVSGMSPTDYDYRVDYENRKIIFNTAPPNAANNIKIDYRYGVPIIVQRSDEVSINNYGLREQKIENEYLLTKQDAIVVAQEYIDSWKNPILNAKYSIRVNPLIDIGETVGVIDYRYFEDNNVRDFGVVSVKHTFVGAKMQTELNLTLITKSVEMYLQDIFTRLNALEEKDKGDKDVLNRLLYFTDTYEILDDPESNLGIYQRTIEDSFILGHPTNSIIGVTLLGDRASAYGGNLVINPSN